MFFFIRKNRGYKLTRFCEFLGRSWKFIAENINGEKVIKIGIKIGRKLHLYKLYWG